MGQIVAKSFQKLDIIDRMIGISTLSNPQFIISNDKKKISLQYHLPENVPKIISINLKDPADDDNSKILDQLNGFILDIPKISKDNIANIIKNKFDELGIKDLVQQPEIRALFDKIEKDAIINNETLQRLERTNINIFKLRAFYKINELIKQQENETKETHYIVNFIKSFLNIFLPQSRKYKMTNDILVEKIEVLKKLHRSIVNSENANSEFKLSEELPSPDHVAINYTSSLFGESRSKQLLEKITAERDCIKATKIE